jgi:uncharacterized protein
MDARELLAIAKTWSFWDVSPPPTVPRRVDLPLEFLPSLAWVVQGVRRSGKSTLLQQIMSRLGEREGISRERCLFLNFEDPRLSSDLNHTTLQQMIEAFEAERGPGCAYFLDEIQWVDGWQRWLRTQLERPQGRRFVVTGSNAHLLAGELGSTLTGRHHMIELFPFDLVEYRKLRPKATLREYLESGGFPASIGSPDHDRLLRGYFQDIVERDMRERVGARSTVPLRQLVQMLFESAGSELSMRRAAAALGVATDTTSLYIDAAESAYIALSSPYFAWSERKRLVRNRKYYPIDTGLRRVCVTETGADRGKSLEIAVFLALRRRFQHVCYWRGQREVDFVVERRGTPIPVQVTWDSPTDRHLDAIAEFQGEHRNAGEGVIVTADSYERGLPEIEAE